MDRDRWARRRQLDVQPADPEQRGRYVEAWNEVQGHFVDMPSAAVGQANGLIIDVMRERGYPIDDFDQRAAGISVDHPDLVENYRRARTIAVANDEGRATTEDSRQAMIRYRALFKEVLPTAEEPAGQPIAHTQQRSVP